MLITNARLYLTDTVIVSRMLREKKATNIFYGGKCS